MQGYGKWYISKGYSARIWYISKGYGYARIWYKSKGNEQAGYGVNGTHTTC